MPNFDEIWYQALSRLQAGQQIRNWGVARGYTGKDFVIDEIHGGYVTVSGGNLAVARQITEDEFAKIFAHWEDYSARRISRADLAAISQNATYILSILNHLLNSENDGVDHRSQEAIEGEDDRDEELAAPNGPAAGASADLVAPGPAVAGAEEVAVEQPAARGFWLLRVLRRLVPGWRRHRA
jgi:hypothetical protein